MKFLLSCLGKCSASLFISSTFPPPLLIRIHSYILVLSERSLLSHLDPCFLSRFTIQPTLVLELLCHRQVRNICKHPSLWDSQQCHTVCMGFKLVPFLTETAEIPSPPSRSAPPSPSLLSFIPIFPLSEPHQLPLYLLRGLLSPV